MQFWSSDWPSHHGMSQYTMLSRYGNCTRLLNIKRKLKIGYAPRWLSSISYPTRTHGIIAKYALQYAMKNKVG